VGEAVKHGDPKQMREEAQNYWLKFTEELERALPRTNLTRRIFNDLLEEGQYKMRTCIDLYEHSRMRPAEEIAPSIESKLP
jgi:hypothetical protein